jgi:hypothetical protein
MNQTSPRPGVQPGRFLFSGPVKGFHLIIAVNGFLHIYVYIVAIDIELNAALLKDLQHIR